MKEMKNVTFNYLRKTISVIGNEYEGIIMKEKSIQVEFLLSDRNYY